MNPFEINSLEFVNDATILVKFISLILMGFIIRYSLIRTGQLWASSYSQTATFVLLPLITFVITNVIAGNIALSLGMVGALSIVRFRNPVRSSLELVIFFLLITLGIASAPKFHWAIVLFLTSNFVIFLIYYLDLFMKKNFKKSFYEISFSEGNELSILEVESKKDNNLLFEDDDLIYYNYDNETHIYRIATNNKDKIFNLKKQLSSIENISKIEISLKK